MYYMLFQPFASILHKTRVDLHHAPFYKFFTFQQGK